MPTLQDGPVLLRKDYMGSTDNLVGNFIFTPSGLKGTVRGACECEVTVRFDNGRWVYLPIADTEVCSHPKHDPQRAVAAFLDEVVDDIDPALLSQGTNRLREGDSENTDDGGNDR